MVASCTDPLSRSAGETKTDGGARDKSGRLVRFRLPRCSFPPARVLLSLPCLRCAREFLAARSGRRLTCLATPIRNMGRVKVRQQLQLSSLSLTTGQTTTRSTNAFRTLVEMVKHEGLGSVYKGLSGSMLRESIYSSVLFLPRSLPCSLVSPPLKLTRSISPPLGQWQRNPDGRLRPRQVAGVQGEPVGRSARVRHETGRRNGERVSATIPPSVQLSIVWGADAPCQPEWSAPRSQIRQIW